ncbi:MAG: metal-dependent hydrolase [PVC group bacterium]|nr:metal-dependent hydrolase [PVC group bacterium]
MNRNGHIICSEFILIVTMSIIILSLLETNPLLTVAISLTTFLFGCCAPDLDHPAVQNKFKIGFLGRITKHRGHWHSIIGMIIYGTILTIPSMMFLTNWSLPVLFGMFGYFSHLAEDDLNSILKGTRRNAIKLW